MIQKKIIHIDMDAFYASVEQRDNPSLKNKPVIVGGTPDSRGVVSACSYEARVFGIHSAMPASQAKRLCPHAIFIYPEMPKYISVSKIIRSIFYQFTNVVEPLSLDEAFLDVTENKFENPSATILAKEIKKKILSETKLIASAGVSYNKFLAKVASDYDKPDGLYVITPQKAQEFIDALPIKKFFGVGKVTANKFIKMGISTGKDLRMMDKIKLISSFGKMGEYFYSIARGRDNRPVKTEHIRKSIGRERTFIKDITNIAEIEARLKDIAEEVSKSLLHNETKGKTVTLKIKYFDFTRITRSITLDKYIDDAHMVYKKARSLFDKTEIGVKPIRLIGISLSHLSHVHENENNIQPELPFI